MKMKVDPLLEEAACKRLLPGDEQVFFPPDPEDYEMIPVGNTTGMAPGSGYQTESADREITAKIRYCLGCPVRLHCLQVGMAEPEGVWGGWSTVERQRGKRYAARPRSVISTQRDKIVRLVQDGETVQDIAVKLGLPDKAIRRYLHEHMSLSVT